MTSEQPEYTDLFPESAGYHRAHLERSAEDEIGRGTIREKHELKTDEPEWLEGPGRGEDAYPSPVDYVMFGLAACQVSVLNQTLHKARVRDFDIEATAEIDQKGTGDAPDEMLTHHAARIEHIAIDLTLTVPAEFEDRAERCLEVYDQGCVVGQSLTAGIDYTPTTHLQTSE